MKPVGGRAGRQLVDTDGAEGADLTTRETTDRDGNRFLYVEELPALAPRLKRAPNHPINRVAEIVGH